MPFSTVEESALANGLLVEDATKACYKAEWGYRKLFARLNDGGTKDGVKSLYSELREIAKKIEAVERKARDLQTKLKAEARAAKSADGNKETSTGAAPGAVTIKKRRASGQDEEVGSDAGSAAKRQKLDQATVPKKTVTKKRGASDQDEEVGSDAGSVTKRRKLDHTTTPKQTAAKTTTKGAAPKHGHTATPTVQKKPTAKAQSTGRNDAGPAAPTTAVLWPETSRPVEPSAAKSLPTPVSDTGSGSIGTLKGCQVAHMSPSPSAEGRTPADAKPDAPVETPSPPVANPASPALSAVSFYADEVELDDLGPLDAAAAVNANIITPSIHDWVLKVDEGIEWRPALPSGKGGNGELGQIYTEMCRVGGTEPRIAGNGKRAVGEQVGEFCFPKQSLQTVELRPANKQLSGTEARQPLIALPDTLPNEYQLRELKQLLRRIDPYLLAVKGEYDSSARATLAAQREAVLPHALKVRQACRSLGRAEAEKAAFEAEELAPAVAHLDACREGLEAAELALDNCGRKGEAAKRRSVGLATTKVGAARRAVDRAQRKVDDAEEHVQSEKARVDGWLKGDRRITTLLLARYRRRAWRATFPGRNTVGREFYWAFIDFKNKVEAMSDLASSRMGSGYNALDMARRHGENEYFGLEPVALKHRGRVRPNQGEL